jgi:hypothetical protein
VEPEFAYGYRNEGMEYVFYEKKDIDGIVPNLRVSG